MSLVEWGELPSNTLYWGQKYKTHYEYKNVKGRILAVSSVRWSVLGAHNTKYKMLNICKNAKIRMLAVSLVRWSVLEAHNAKYKTNARECPWLDGVYWGHKIQNTKQMQESVLG